jgi:DNA-binding MarR family transcriptional regulator
MQMAKAPEQVILDSIRLIVKSLRNTSKEAELTYGLSGAQVFVLQKLAESKPLSINELAARTLTHQSSVSVVVAKLCEKELAKKTPDSRDARKSRLSITSKGEKILKDAKPAAQIKLIDALKKMKKTDLAQLARLLPEAVSLAGMHEEIAPLFLEESVR